ncbi:MAG: YdcH family protein [Alphaproteobacteria bacterium]|nr:YdcH family protein [Alphaproteobacteria bacterium]MBO4644211.1 YdcH family protein [Alphaproteobacteria bacterium]
MKEENAHLQALRAKHAALDEEIAKEMARPLPDETTISSLKRQKLKLKEEIESETGTAS